MEIKIECGCGTKYKFDVEPVNGRVPVPVQCPACGALGNPQANQIISRALGSPMRVAAQPIAVAAAAPASAPPPVSSAQPYHIAPAAPAASRYEAAQAAGLLDRRLFLIKERVAVLKLTDTYDIVDPASGQAIGIAKEEPPAWAKWLRLAINKHTLPTSVNIYEAEGQPPLITVHRPFRLIGTRVHLITGGQKAGYFKKKLLSLGGGFNMFNPQDQRIGEVKGDWKGWNFRFLDQNGRELGTVTKKWAGLGKELFTSADNYVVSLTSSNPDPSMTAILLAAGVSIDVIFKEGD